MRNAGTTLAIAILIMSLAGSAASSPPTTVGLRVEGRSRTLFEGPLLTTGHVVQASSDPQTRSCDATNGGAHPTPGPTPTVAGVDAMSIAGQTFDGTWSPG